MNKKLKKLIIISVLSSMISIIAPISINIGIIPISFATLIIYITSSITKRFDGVIATIIYISLGIIGIPVFSYFTGGLQKILGPTGGYIIGYIFLSLVISIFMNICNFQNKLYFYPIIYIIGTILCYICGSIWYMITTSSNLINTIYICIIPFVIPDIIKIIFATIISYIINTKYDLRKRY